MRPCYELPVRDCSPSKPWKFARCIYYDARSLAPTSFEREPCDVAPQCEHIRGLEVNGWICEPCWFMEQLPINFNVDLSKFAIVRYHAWRGLPTIQCYLKGRHLTGALTAQGANPPHWFILPQSIMQHYQTMLNRVTT